MSFKLYKPALVPVRGTDLNKPVESLHYAVNLLGRVIGDPDQSAVRLGELIQLGIIRRMENGEIAAGQRMETIELAIAKLLKKVGGV